MNGRVILDRAGRVVLPKALRDELNLSSGDTLDLRETKSNCGPVAVLPSCKRNAASGCSAPASRSPRKKRAKPPGRGRKPTYGTDKIAAIVDATLQTKPAGMTHWSCRTMARSQGVSKSTIEN
jgi:AbrB family looped-hinge helix DNA binding protein